LVAIQLEQKKNLQMLATILWLSYLTSIAIAAHCLYNTTTNTWHPWADFTFSPGQNGYTAPATYKAKTVQISNVFVDAPEYTPESDFGLMILSMHCALHYSWRAACMCS